MFARIFIAPIIDNYEDLALNKAKNNKLDFTMCKKN